MLFRSSNNGRLKVISLPLEINQSYVGPAIQIYISIEIAIYLFSFFVILYIFVRTHSETSFLEPHGAAQLQCKFVCLFSLVLNLWFGSHAVSLCTVKPRRGSGRCLHPDYQNNYPCVQWWWCLQCIYTESRIIPSYSYDHWIRKVV